MLLKCFILLLLKNCCVSGKEVITNFGKINGTEKQLTSTTLYVYLGIPYAVPPLGHLRFKDPLPYTGQYPEGKLDAKTPKTCVQSAAKGVPKFMGEEDCLTLNIYTTEWESDAKRDVLVFIHGGAFFYGSGHVQTPDYLFDKYTDLVFVSINYRLGPFGFLSTNDGVVPGNMGLKDQVVALQWIKENIKCFGGNPENILIVGLSAGGVSVHLHYLSPLSRDLFTKGISMSGTALSLLVKTDDSHIKEGFEILKNLFPECNGENTFQVVECLRNISAQTLQEKVVDKILMEPWADYMTSLYFGPVIEKNSDNAFLKGTPLSLLKQNEVKQAPWLVGATTSEGLEPVARFVLDDNKIKVLNEKWNVIAPYLLNYKQSAKEAELRDISDRVKKYFFSEPDWISSNNITSIKTLIKIVGDRVHLQSLEDSIRLQASASNASTFIYMFDYRGENSFSNFLSRSDRNLGVCHGDDLIYTLKIPNMTPNTTDDIHIKEFMVEMWGKFLRNDAPFDLWRPFNKSTDNIDCLLIGNEGNKFISPENLVDAVSFWKSLPIN